MGNIRETAQLLELLGDAWLMEPDAPLLERLATVVPVGATDVVDLAVLWAETFLQTVPPYASLFLSDDGMLNSWPADRAAQTYADAGFQSKPEWRAGAPDHLGVQLHFLALLLPDRPKRTELFLREQLLPWAPICCLAVERAAIDPLFTAIARLTLNTVVELANV